MTHEELREKVAGAIRECWRDAMNLRAATLEWEEIDAEEREYCLAKADAALAAVREALREPSEEMIFAAADLPSPCLFSTVWRAMLAASPLAEPQA